MFEIVITVLACLGASAFCSVTEASFYSVPPSTVEVLERQKKFTARYLKHVKDNIDRYIASVLVVNTVANTVGASLATALAVKRLTPSQAMLLPVVLTILILLFGEITPKTLGVKQAKVCAPLVAVPFYYPEAMLGFDPATGEELPKFKGVTMLADLARRGFVAATADAYHLTYRPGAAEPRDDFRRWAKAAEALARDWPCWTGIGKLTADTRLVIDLLAADPRVDAARIGIIGHSLGGKMAFYAGCLDPRVQVIVTSDWGIDWDGTNWKDPWYWGAARVDAMKAAGRTHAVLLAYAGGKPFMLIAGKYDNAASARAVLDRVPAYRAHPERCVVLDHASGHRPPPDALEAGYRFLEKHLKIKQTDKEQK